MFKNVLGALVYVVVVAATAAAVAILEVQKVDRAVVDIVTVVIVYTLLLVTNMMLTSFIILLFHLSLLLLLLLLLLYMIRSNVINVSRSYMPTSITDYCFLLLEVSYILHRICIDVRRTKILAWNAGYSLHSLCNLYKYAIVLYHQHILWVQLVILNQTIFNEQQRIYNSKETMSTMMENKLIE